MTRKPRHHIPGWLIGAMEAVPGRPLAVTAWDPDRLDVRVAGGPPVSFRVVTRQPAAASNGAPGSSSDGTVVLILADRFSANVRERLANEGASWIEAGTGVIHLVAPGLYVSTRLPEARLPETSIRPTRLRGQSGVCAETLLTLATHRREVRTGELAELAGVSPSLATGVLQRLEREGIVVSRGQGKRDRSWMLLDPGAILDLWAEEEGNGEPDRTSSIHLRVGSRTPHDLLRRMMRLQSLAGSWAIGGMSAARLHAGAPTVDAPLTVWIPQGLLPSRAAAILEGEIVRVGHNVVLQQQRGDAWARCRLPRTPGSGAARGDARSPVSGASEALPALVQQVPGLAIVTPQRAYVEARTFEHERASEVADVLRRRLLAQLLPQALLANAAVPDAHG